MAMMKMLNIFKSMLEGGLEDPIIMELRKLKKNFNQVRKYSINNYNINIFKKYLFITEIKNFVDRKKFLNIKNATIKIQKTFRNWMNNHHEQ
jgi:hypothetical protein